MASDGTGIPTVLLDKLEKPGRDTVSRFGSCFGTQFVLKKKLCSRSPVDPHSGLCFTIIRCRGLAARARASGEDAYACEDDKTWENSEFHCDRSVQVRRDMQMTKVNSTYRPHAENL
jgi:hypothetical protein